MKIDTLSNGSTRSSQFGLWKFWYESGQPKLEVLYTGQRKEYRYINMWTPNGIQILTSGSGIYYNVEHISDVSDSTVYIVIDSILGEFSQYRKWHKFPKYDDYYLVSNGSSINGLLEGTVSILT